jgi:hypothetical protein
MTFETAPLPLSCPTAIVCGRGDCASSHTRRVARSLWLPRVPLPPLGTGPAHLPPIASATIDQKFLHLMQPTSDHSLLCQPKHVSNEHSGISQALSIKRQHANKVGMLR